MKRRRIFITSRICPEDWCINTEQRDVTQVVIVSFQRKREATDAGVRPEPSVFNFIKYVFTETKLTF